MYIGTADGMISFLYLNPYMDVPRKLENLPMRIIPILLLTFLISAIVLPVGAEAPNYDDMLKKAQNLNVTVPEKGSAVLGTKESMTEYLGWLNACTAVMITFVNDVMDVFGVGNTPYAQNMKNTLEKGQNLSPARTGK